MTFLDRCNLFIGMASARLHMAVSLGIASVGIIGPTSLVNYRPVGPYVEIACSGVACSPCFHFVGSHPVWAGSRCRVPTCLHALAVTSVLDAAERALARKGDETKAGAGASPLAPDGMATVGPAPHNSSQ